MDVKRDSEIAVRFLVDHITSTGVVKKATFWLVRGGSLFTLYLSGWPRGRNSILRQSLR